MALPTAGTGAEQDQFWPMPKFYFSVDIGEFTDLPFQEVSGLDVETEVIEYQTPRMTWTLTNAFPKQITPTDMNSQASEAAIETMVLAHEGMVAEVG